MKSPAYWLLICMCLAKSSADVSSGNSSFSPLDEDQKMKLYWNIDMANKEIYFTVEAQTTGWVGFGISSGQGKMVGADIVIGWVKDGKPYFKVKQTRSKFRISLIPSSGWLCYINAFSYSCRNSKNTSRVTINVLALNNCKLWTKLLSLKKIR